MTMRRFSSLNRTLSRGTRNVEPVHGHAADRREAGFVGVGPVDVRLRTRGRDLDLVAAPGHAFGHLPAVLLGTAGDRVAVTLHDVEQPHQTTSSSASTSAASGGQRSSSANLPLAAGDQRALQLLVAEHLGDRLGEEHRTLLRRDEQRGPTHGLGNRGARAATIGLAKVIASRSGRQKPSCSLAVTTAVAEVKKAARSASSTAPTMCTPPSFSSCTCSRMARVIAIETVVPDEHQDPFHPEVRLGDVHHLHEEVGPLVRHELAHRQQDRSPERGQVIERRPARRDLREAADLDDGRNDPHVAIPHLRQLARVVLRVGERADDAWQQAFDLATTHHEQIGEDRVVPFEVPARRHVVVHENERLGPLGEERVHLGLPDRRVEDQDVLRRPRRAVQHQRQHLARQLGCDVGGVDLRGPDPAQERTAREREVRDRVAGRGRDEHLMNTETGRLGHRRGHRSLTASRRWRSPAGRRAGR